MEKFDLHVHSSLSDGEFDRAYLIEKALEKEFSAISFVDHNIAISEMKRKNIEIIPGVEIDCGSPYKIHIVGYYIKNEERVNKVLNDLKRENNDICYEIINNLKNYYGLNITDRDIELVKKEYLTKRNIIEILLKKEYIKTVKESKEKYTGSKTKKYIPIKKLDAKSVIEMINESGGIPVLAHPNTMFNEITINDFETILRNMVNQGLQGIEVMNLKEGYKYQYLFEKLAKKYNLITTVGSDFHTESREEFGVTADEEKYLYPLLVKKMGK